MKGEVLLVFFTPSIHGVKGIDTIASTYIHKYPFKKKGRKLSLFL
jgi:succinate dehydrogenase hydrophobic anchor subunit